MPLPKLAIPEYDLTLPITGTKITYRPFLVKEEKLAVSRYGVARRQADDQGS